jgi:GNAT superfamily N-acetyltransferase
MISNIDQVIERKFFKKRHITLIDKEDFPRLLEPKKDESISCKVEDTVDKKYLEDIIINICDDENIAKSIKRIFEIYTDTVIISASYKGETAGCILIMIPSQPIIYDSCKYTPNQVHFAQLYVNSNYRRKGISSYLRHSAFNYWYNNYPSRTVVGIIEKSNDASFQGAKKMNYKFGGTNYLIKFFGKNIMSITNCAGKWEFLLLFRDTKSKRI